MKLKDILIIIVLIALLSSCKAKQIIVEKTLTIHDTIRVETIKEIQVPIESTIVIDNPCDSLGILKEFKQTIKTKTVDVTVEGKDGHITASINLDSIKQSTIKEYKSHQSEEKEVVTIIKYRIPKWVWYSLGLNAILIAFVFRKKIPFLKLLPF